MKNSCFVVACLFCACVIDPAPAQLTAAEILTRATGFVPNTFYLDSMKPGAIVSIDSGNGAVELICDSVSAIGSSMPAPSPYPDVLLKSDNAVSVTINNALASRLSQLQMNAKFKSVTSLTLVLDNARTESLGYNDIVGPSMRNRTADCNTSIARRLGQRDSKGNTPELFFVTIAMVADMIYGVATEDSVAVEAKSALMADLAIELKAKYDQKTGKLLTGTQQRFGVAVLPY